MKYLILSCDSRELNSRRKEWLEGLVSYGHEIYVSVPLDVLEGDLQDIGVCVMKQRVNCGKSSFLKALRLLNEYRILIKRVKPDYIVTYTNCSAICGGLLASRYCIPYTVNISDVSAEFDSRQMFFESNCILWRKALKNVEHVLFRDVENASVFERYNIIGLEKMCIGDVFCNP